MTEEDAEMTEEDGISKIKNGRERNKLTICPYAFFAPAGR